MPTATVKGVEGALPPGPRGPAALLMARVQRDPIAFFTGCARRYGPMFTVPMGAGALGRMVFVAEPDLARPLFTASPDVLRAGAANAIIEPLVGRRSLLLLDGDAHLHRRKLELPAFHGERVAQWGERIGALARREVESWPLGTPFAVRPRLQRLTLDVILRVGFGVDRSDGFTALRDATTAFLATASSIAIWVGWLRRDLGPRSPWGRLVRARRRLDALLAAEIEARVGAPGLNERGDFLSMLCSARDERGEPLTREALLDELRTILLAGHETSATGMAWTLELLGRHPAEMDAVLGDLEEGSTTRLDASVKESLRLRPPVFDCVRAVHEPFALGDHLLPAGVGVAPAIVAIHRDEGSWPHSGAFRPERFLDGRPPAYAWIPFGGGTRRCLGAAFATLEMREVLREALTLRSLRPAGSKPERTRLENVIVAPRDGVRLVAASKAAVVNRNGYSGTKAFGRLMPVAAPLPPPLLDDRKEPGETTPPISAPASRRPDRGDTR